MMSWPWGLHMTRLILGSDYYSWKAPANAEQYWYTRYRIEGIITLSAIAGFLVAYQTGNLWLAVLASALVGMVLGRRDMHQASLGQPRQVDRPALGLSLFEATTPCTQRVAALLGQDFECLSFHADGIGTAAMEHLLEGGRLAGVVDLSPHDLANLVAGADQPADEDRLGAAIRSGRPYVGSCGGLDCVRILATDPRAMQPGAPRLVRSGARALLMPTRTEDCTRLGRWIGHRLNQMPGPVRFVLPEKGLSANDAPGQPLHDPVARAALFEAIEATVRQTSARRLVRVPLHINEPAMAREIAAIIRALHGDRLPRRAVGARS